MCAFEAYHASGNILADYAEDVCDDPDIFTMVRENGLEELFDRADIRTFFKEAFYLDYQCEPQTHEMPSFSLMTLQPA